MSLTTLQPLSSGFQYHQITSLLILPTRRLISLSQFQMGIGAAAHATLDMEQLISCIRVALVDTISSLPDSEGGVIPVSEMHDLHIKIHDILDNFVSKWVGTSAHILNSASRLL